MGQFFDSLTKSGLQDANGNTTFYGSPSETAVNFAKQSKAPTLAPVLPKSIPLVSDAPANAQAPLTYAQNVNPSGDLVPGGGTIDATPTPVVMKTTPAPPQPVAEFKEEGGYSPKIVKPSFNDINVDAAGNQKRLTPNSGLTKLGALFSVLGGGVQGMSDALAGGAMDAHNGPDRPSPFGAGVRGAMEMPIFRAQRAADLARESAVTGATQAQAAHTQAETAAIPAQAALAKAHTDYFASLAGKKDQRTPQEVYDAAWADAQANGEDPTTSPKVQQALLALQNYERSLALAHPGKQAPSQQEIWDQRTQEAAQLGLSGDEKKFYVVNGKLREPAAVQPRQPTDAEQWSAAFTAENGHHPTAQDWIDYKRGQGDRPATRGQIAASETRKNNALRQVENAYKWDGTQYVNRGDKTDTLSPEEYTAQLQRVQDAYEQERAELTGEEQAHYDMSQREGAPESAKSTKPIPKGLFPTKGSNAPKPLDAATAQAILQEAGGDKDKARAIAKQRNYTF